MEILIVGCGSIGLRHADNLIKMGHKAVTCFDISEQALSKAISIGAKTSSDFQKSLAGADAVIICTPNHMHTDLMLDSLKKGKHVFVEKPISNSTEKLEDVLKLSKDKRLVFQVGHNLRFHPLITKIKDNLKDIGKVYNVHAEYGSYLPFWRPGTDYTKNYSAKKSMGGGIILDDIHEIEYIIWMFGLPEHVFCFSGKLSDLKIDTEDNADIFLQMPSGISVTIHMDYIQRPPVRTLKIVGSDGIIEGDINSNSFRIFKEGSWHEEKADFDYNQTYIEEIRHFIECVKNNRQPAVSFHDGFNALRVALASKKSSISGKVVRI